MIQLNNLSFFYEVEKPLIEDLNIEASAGSIVGLLGRNGVGKTTLLHLVAGLLFPKQGHISVFGTEPKARLPRFLNDIYFVPEDFYLPATTVEKYINAYHVFYPHFDHSKCNRLLSDQDIAQKDHLEKLSTGQRKKFIISFALSTGCKVLLFDEPTNGLDIPSKSEFKKTIASSIAEDQIVIISTHQVKDIELLIDSVWILDDGKIKLQASLTDISTQFAFAHIHSLEGTNIVYSEPSFNGYKTIIAQENDGDNVDLELLFNAVVSNRFPTTHFNKQMI